MGVKRQHSDAIHWFMNDLASRVVAKSGIPSDRYHIGKLIMQSFKDAPEHILNIDGATGKCETFRSVLERSVRCATALKALGLKEEDVVLISGPNHIDLTIPMYAALYLGINVSCMDPALGMKEQQDLFQICRPKLIFCQSEKEEEAAEAARNLNLEAQIITFNKGKNNNDFTDFLQNYGDNTPVDKFEIMYSHFPTPFERALILSPIQWVSATSSFIFSPLLRFTRIQSSQAATTEHVYSLINKYKPSYMMINPNTMTSLLKPGDREKCDLSCFSAIMLAGSAASKTLLQTMKEVIPNVSAYNGYGMTEATTVVFNPVYTESGSSGTPLGPLQYRLIDPATEQDIQETNVPGELWIKGPITFKGYFNNSEATAECYTEDKWLKSGDIVYIDEHYHFHFVDRLKSLLKYRNHQISPIEIEATIFKHPGVQNVAVTGIIDDESGELPVACVVPRDNYKLTAQEIKDLVKEFLTDSKQLRGGVIFMKQLPLTSSSKVNRKKLKDMAQTLKAE